MMLATVPDRRGAYKNHSHVRGSVHKPIHPTTSWYNKHGMQSGVFWYAPSPSSTVDRHRLIESVDTQFWTSIYSAEITSSERLLAVRSLLSCPSKIAVARSFKGNEAQTFIDFLDRVSEVCAPRHTNLRFKPQVLTKSCLDDKFRQRSLLLLSKICKARSILPSSYLLKQKFIYVGRVHYHGGFAEVSNGGYLGSAVAIKSLKTNEEDSDRIFKVP